MADASAQTGADDTKAVEAGGYLTVLFAVIGFGALIASLCSLLLSTAFAGPQSLASEGLTFRALFLAGFATVQGFSSTDLPDTFDTPASRSIIRLAAFALSAAIAAFSLLEIAPSSTISALQAGLWLAFGFTVGEVFVFWGIVWCAIDAERDDGSFCSIAVATAVLGAAIVCSAMPFAPHLICTAAGTAFFAAAIILQRICERRIPEAEHLSSADSRRRFELWGIEMLTPASASLALGVALALNGLVLGANAAFETALIGVGAGGIVALTVTAVNHATPRTSSVERVTFPVFGACLLALPFTPGTLAFQVVMAVLIADLSCYLVFHWNVLVLLSYRKRLKPAYHFGQGMIATSMGMALGWGGITVAAWTVGVMADGYEAPGWGPNGIPVLVSGEMGSIVLISCLATVLILIIVLSAVPFATNVDVESLFANAELPDKQLAALTWNDACSSLCEEHGLTPREREVFSYLARGRNADHIAGELFISVHTAKTHTGRIYRKFEVNSQQQLIDAVEEKQKSLSS